MGGDALGVRFGMVLLGGATCETSKVQTHDTVFAAGRRLHTAMSTAGAVAVGDCLELHSELEDMAPKVRLSPPSTSEWKQSVSP